ncbi:hypothetical protein [Bacillus testis]|uniref:hypothetical protein n=1 Tax=Bacillus testis TaxID=1622072 RepID=UPI00067F227B|nr:hypothetical protein [Bacillus testis]
MMKKVIVLNGMIINVGEWESSEPMPEGAVIEEREMEYNEDRGWFEMGELALPTDKKRIEMLENMILMVMEG